MEPNPGSPPDAVSYRGRFDDWLMAGVLSPLVRLCCRWGIRPNAVTAAGLLISAAVPFLHQAGFWTPAAAAMIVRQLCDCLDGAVARRSGRVSILGAVLDSISDAIFYYALLWVIASRIAHGLPATAALAAAALLVLGGIHATFGSSSALLHHPKTYDTPSLYRRGYAFVINNSLLFVVPLAALYRLTAG